MIYKGCDRCEGDLFVEEEGRFKDLVCLQCGFRPKNGPALIDQLHLSRPNRSVRRRRERHGIRVAT